MPLEPLLEPPFNKYVVTQSPIGNRLCSPVDVALLLITLNFHFIIIPKISEHSPLIFEINKLFYKKKFAQSKNNGSRVSQVCLGGDIGRVGSFAAEGIRVAWGLKGQMQNVNESKAVLQDAGERKVKGQVQNLNESMTLIKTFSEMLRKGK